MNDLTSEKDNEKNKRQLFLPFSVDRILQIDRNCNKKVKLACDLNVSGKRAYLFQLLLLNLGFYYCLSP